MARPALRRGARTVLRRLPVVLFATLLAIGGPAAVPVIGLVASSDVIAPGPVRVSTDAEVALEDTGFPSGRLPTASERTWTLGNPSPTPSAAGSAAPKLGSAAGVVAGAVSPSAPPGGPVVAAPRLLIGGPATTQVVPDVPGVNSRVSLASDGTEGNDASGGPPPPTRRFGSVMSHGGEAISADARFVAFASIADNLVSDDTNGTSDIFLRDRVKGTTIRIPYLKGTQIPVRFAAAEPAINEDGSVVAFTVHQKLTPTAPVGVFVWDASTGITTVASTDDGVTFPATQPAVSGDGRWVAYERPYTFRERTYSQIFVFDREQNTSAMVSLQGRLPAVGYSRAPTLSRDGRFLAFESDAVFTKADTNEASDIYLLDRSDGSFTRISEGPGARQADGPSVEPSISFSGDVVGFASQARNLVDDPATPTLLARVYVWERARGGIRLVSLDQGSHADDASFGASVSADGNYVGFWSAPPGTLSTNSDDPIPGVLPVDGPGDVFLRDLRRDLTTRISVDGGGNQVSGDSEHPSVSGNGMATAFDSTAPDLVAKDTNKVRDVFVRDFVPAASVTPTELDFGSKILGALGGPLSVTVTSIGWPPLDVTSVERAGGDAGDFRIAVDGCSGKSLSQGASCEIQVTFRPSAVGARAATLRILDTSQTTPHSVRLLGAGGQIVLTVNPVIGPPGIVTVVSGTGFPPGGTVSLRWDRGISATMAPVVVDASGKFRVQMLVFHHDQIGPRNLVATDVGGGSFPTAKVAFKVVVPTAQPPALGPFRFLPPGAKPIVDRH